MQEELLKEIESMSIVLVCYFYVAYLQLIFRTLG